MPDRLKQAIFNILGSSYGTPGLLPEIGVADVFAGSGSMGLEALSRGASRCIFYENGGLALKCLRQNIVELKAEHCSEVVTSDAWTTAAQDAGRRAIELLFLDPPYRDTQDASTGGYVGDFLSRIAIQSGRPWPTVVLHHFAKVDYTKMELPATWTVSDYRTFGSSSVTFFCPSVLETKGTKPE